MEKGQATPAEILPSGLDGIKVAAAVARVM